MTSPFLIPDLKTDEGCRLEAYPDPLTGGDPWTIGYGATGPTIVKTSTWTQAMADRDLQVRVDRLTVQLGQTLPWWETLSDLRQDVFVNMAYNIGLSGLLAFHNTLSMAEAKNYAGAATGMLASRWANQVPNRAKRLSQQMATGVHA